MIAGLHPLRERRDLSLTLRSDGSLVWPLSGALPSGGYTVTVTALRWLSTKLASYLRASSSEAHTPSPSRSH